MTALAHLCQQQPCDFACVQPSVFHTCGNDLMNTDGLAWRSATMLSRQGRGSWALPAWVAAAGGVSRLVVFGRCEYAVEASCKSVLVRQQVDSSGTTKSVCSIGMRDLHMQCNLGASGMGS